jgi:hypothetical protein
LRSAESKLLTVPKTRLKYFGDVIDQLISTPASSAPQDTSPGGVTPQVATTGAGSTRDTIRIPHLPPPSSSTGVDGAPDNTGAKLHRILEQIAVVKALTTRVNLSPYSDVLDQIADDLEAFTGLYRLYHRVEFV